jgi:hypothetical protein
MPHSSCSRSRVRSRSCVPTLRHGSGLTPDSASYIAAARNLARGRGATLYDGRPMTLWPPLFPAVMAAMSFVTRLDPIRLAPFLCAALFGFTVYATGLLFTRVFGRPSPRRRSAPWPR